MAGRSEVRGDLEKGKGKRDDGIYRGRHNENFPKNGATLRPRVNDAIVTIVVMTENPNSTL